MCVCVSVRVRVMCMQIFVSVQVVNKIIIYNVIILNKKQESTCYVTNAT